MFKKDTPSLIIEVLTARIKEWYNGYHVQNKQGDKHSFYNPYDVMCYLRNCVMFQKICRGKSFWVETASD